MGRPALKRLERSWRSGILRAAAHLLPRPERGMVPDWPARSHRVLYMLYGRIGDMIMATGLIRAIARSHPTIELDVLASPVSAPVLEGNPHVRRLLLFDRRRRSALPSVLRELRGGDYDVVVDGSALVPSVTMMLLMLATRAPFRVGIGGRRNDVVYTLPVAPAPGHLHAIEQAARLATPFGVDPAATDWRPELFLRAEERAWAEGVWGPRGAGPRVVVNVSAAIADRRWPLGNYAAVVRHMRAVDRAARLLVIAAPPEQEAATAMAADAGARLVPTAGVREAFALVDTADAVVTPDTSIAHAAAASRVPVAVLLKGGWTLHAPYGVPQVRVEADGPTLADLPVARVLPAVDELFAMVHAGGERRGRELTPPGRA